MSERECISKLSKVLFWDMDMELVNMDFLIQIKLNIDVIVQNSRIPHFGISSKKSYNRKKIIW